jgi:1-acyl-sn-glycerol-3-phosphate acyltransferase
MVDKAASMVNSALNKASLGVIFRSCLFNGVFYLNLTAFLVLGSWLFIAPRVWAMQGLKLWALSSLWWLRVICGTRLDVRGREHLPAGAYLCAGKHQSSWETFALIPLLRDPAVVLKRELTFIPLFGWFALKFRMIALDRGAGSKSLKGLIAQAKAAAALGREIVIFPEGTRRAPGAAPDYKPGAAALYGALDLPCVPFALNSGHFWPRRQFLRWPGTIVVEFLPVIGPGLARRDFQRVLEEVVETTTARLSTLAVRDS